LSGRTRIATRMFDYPSPYLSMFKFTHQHTQAPTVEADAAMKEWGIGACL
jgi:hypothetical protein